jgi:hypothetical protein
VQGVESFAHLQGDERVRFVAVGMVLDKEVPCFIMSVLGNQPDGQVSARPSDKGGNDTI